MIGHAVFSAIRDAHRTRSAIERAACYRVASHVLEQITALMQDVGVVDSQVGLMIRAMRNDGQKVERIPSGLELQDIFANAVISRDDLTSDAERAMVYRDAEAYERLKTEPARRVHGLRDRRTDGWICRAADG